MHKFGTLINHLGMRKINTRGIESANKNMLMAAIAYNLKKVLKYSSGDIARMAQTDYRQLQTTCYSIFKANFSLFREVVNELKNRMLFCSLKFMLPYTPGNGDTN